MRHIVKILLLTFILSTGVNAISAQRKGNAQKRIFEGTLYYLEYLYITEAAEVLGYSPNISGISPVKKIISGNKIHIINERLQHHTIIDRDNNKYIVYSDLTKEGYIYDLLAYEDMFLYHIPYTETLGWQGHDNETYNGMNVIHSIRRNNYKVEEGFLAGEWNATGEMYWSEEYLPAPIMTHVQGDSINGIPLCSIVETTAGLNYGYVRKVKSEQLLEVCEYKVNDDEFVLPDDIKVLTSTKFLYAPWLNLQIIMKKLYKNQLKAAKKMQLLRSDDRESTLAQIRQVWSNVADAGEGEGKMRSVFSMMVEGYGVQNLANDVAGLLNQTAELISPPELETHENNSLTEDYQQVNPGRSRERTRSNDKPQKKENPHASSADFARSNLYDRTYRDYENKLRSMKYGGSPYSDISDRQRFQNEMRRIREYAKKNGLREIHKSEWEDWDGN